MAQLKPQEQRFLVELLAVYTAVPDVVELFEKEFGKAIDRKQVHEYNVERPANRAARSDELVKLFDDVREAYLNETKNTRIAHSGWRQRELETIYLEERRLGRFKGAKATLEQAAKESGGAFTNRHELTGKDGAPLPAPTAAVVVDLSKLSPAQLDALEALHGGDPESAEHSSGEGPA